MHTNPSKTYPHIMTVKVQRAGHNQICLHMRNVIENSVKK
ncbi:hypothetical protein HMPREF1492_0215 [Atopobium sp. BS2]|nr:hypothetical protein HMPREF1492_0215 [Atopobium sp. BS2]